MEHLVVQIILTLFVIFFSTGVGVYFHELGHVWAYREKTGITPRMKFKYDCNGMSNEDYKTVLESGILLGLLAVLLTAYLMQLIAGLDNTVLYLTFGMYLSGCLDDCKNWLKIRRIINGQQTSLQG